MIAPGRVAVFAQLAVVAASGAPCSGWTGAYIDRPCPVLMRRIAAWITEAGGASDPARIERLAELVARFAPECVSSLVVALSGPLTGARLMAAKALGRLRASEALRGLHRILDERAAPGLLRSAALDAVGRIGDPSSPPALVRVMRSDGNLRSRAAAILLGMRSRRAVPYIIEMLGSSRPGESVKALQTLRRWFPDRHLRPAAREPGPWRRWWRQVASWVPLASQRR